MPGSASGGGSEVEVTSSSVMAPRVALAVPLCVTSIISYGSSMASPVTVTSVVRAVSPAAKVSVSVVSYMVAGSHGRCPTWSSHRLTS